MRNGSDLDIGLFPPRSKKKGKMNFTLRENREMKNSQGVIPDRYHYGIRFHRPRPPVRSETNETIKGRPH